MENTSHARARQVNLHEPRSSYCVVIPDVQGLGSFLAPRLLGGAVGTRLVMVDGDGKQARCGATTEDVARKTRVLRVFGIKNQACQWHGCCNRTVGNSLDPRPGPPVDTGLRRYGVLVLYIRGEEETDKGGYNLSMGVWMERCGGRFGFISHEKKVRSKSKM